MGSEVLTSHMSYISSQMTYEDAFKGQALVVVVDKWDPSLMEVLCYLHGQAAHWRLRLLSCISNITYMLAMHYYICGATIIKMNEEPN